MFLYKNLDQMMRETGSSRISKFDLLIPEKDTHLFVEDSLLQSVRFFTPSKDYEISIANLVDLHGERRTWVLHEAFLNVFGRAHKGETYLPVSVKVFSGEKGSVVRIVDSGYGFDYYKAVECVKRREGYGEFYSNGFEIFRNDPHVGVWFEGRGNIINLQILRTQ